MAQQTKSPGDRYTDESLDPYQREADEIFNRPDMRALDDRMDAIARDRNDHGDSGGQFDGGDAAAADRRAAEAQEWESAKNKMADNPRSGHKTSIRDLINKKNALRGGIAGGVIGIALALFGFLTPFKLPALLQTVTDETGQRVEQITVQRAKVILARAILSKFGYSGGVVVTGKGPVSSLIATMRTNKFEDKLRAKGIEIIDVKGQGIRLKLNGNYIDNGQTLKSERMVLAAFEGRPVTNKLIKDLVKEEIPTWRWMKRAKFASWLRIKYGISRFGTKKTTETDKEKKIADIQTDRLEGRYGQYTTNMLGAVGCVMSDPGCPIQDSKRTLFEKFNDKIRGSAGALTTQLKESLGSQTKEIIQKKTTSIAAKINEQLEDLMIKKFATKAIPIIGWIDLAATVDNIAYNGLENDFITKIPAYYRSIAYAQMYAEWAGYGDQVKAGEMDSDYMAVLATQLDGAEEAMAFQYISGNGAKGTIVKQKINENDASLIKQVWERFKTNPLSAYYRYVNHPVLNAYYNTIGSGGLLGSIGGLFSSAISGIISAITPDQLEKYMSDYLSEMLGKLFIAIGLSADPLDTGADLFNDIYAGGEVSFNTYCKESLGCRKLTDEQVGVQNRTIAYERAQQIKEKGWLYAAFSPDVTGSLTNQLAIALPSSLAPQSFNLEAGVGQLASLITGTPQRLLNAPSTQAGAATGYINLNGINNYGATAADLALPLAEETISGDPCPEKAVDDYNGCKVDKTVAEAMLCDFKPDGDNCNFLNNMSGEATNVMTYNVLGMTAGSDNNNDGDISWRTRINNVVSAVTQASPDVIGFQEVQQTGSDNQYERLSAALSSTYDNYPPGPEEARTRVIMWKKSLFSLVGGGTYSYPRYNNPSADFPWVKLRSVATNNSFYVFNTHTVAGNKDSGRTVGGLTAPEARREEIKLLAAAVKRVNTDNLPVVLTGDYNSTCEVTPNDDPMSLNEIPCKILAGAGFSDAGETANSAGTAVNFEYNTTHGSVGEQVKNGRQIDRIFFSQGIGVKSWKNIIDDTTKMASDHSPVVAGLIIPGITTAVPASTGNGDTTLPVGCSKPAPGSVPGAIEPAADYSRVRFRGVTLNARTRTMIETAEKYAQSMGINASFSLTQGSYNKGGVAASAGTHDGGGAVDFSVNAYSNTQEMKVVRALRMAGFAAWPRTTSEGFSGNHIHAIAIGDREAAPLAKQQMAAYFSGKNGLSGNGADTGASVGRPYPDWAAGYCKGGSVST